MSVLFERIGQLYAQSARLGGAGLHEDGPHVPANLRPAAVLLAITERAEPGVLLTRRPPTMRVHAGQVAFPGGKLEPGEDAIGGALREAEEELAIAPHEVRVIGVTQSFATGSGYRLTPVLGLIPPDLPIRPDPREVDLWFEVPLRFVLDKRNHARKVGRFGPVDRPYTEIVWQGHRIWGITAGILAHLSHRLAWQELIG